MPGGGIINDEMFLRPARSQVTYRVKGLTVEHQVALKTALSDVPGLDVVVRDGELYVTRDLARNAAEFKKFYWQVDAALKVVAPDVEAVNTFPGKPPRQ